MEALFAALLALAPMNPEPDELGPEVLVCVRKPDSDGLQCVEYDAFQAALRKKLLEASPKKGEI